MMRTNDGYYDDNGRWQRTKFCFVSCGDRCTCGPPMGLHYNPMFDKSKDKKPEAKPDDPLRGISMENVRR